MHGADVFRPCLRACVQENDMVMNRGHSMDWFSNKWGANHWSRKNGCQAYKCVKAKRMGGCTLGLLGRGTSV